VLDAKGKTVFMSNRATALLAERDGLQPPLLVSAQNEQLLDFTRQNQQPDMLRFARGKNNVSGFGSHAVLKGEQDEVGAATYTELVKQVELCPLCCLLPLVLLLNSAPQC
jgi:hypothetical protein